MCNHDYQYHVVYVSLILYSLASYIANEIKINYEASNCNMLENLFICLLASYMLDVFIYSYRGLMFL